MTGAIQVCSAPEGVQQAAADEDLAAVARHFHSGGEALPLRRLRRGRGRRECSRPAGLAVRPLPSGWLSGTSNGDSSHQHGAEQSRAAGALCQVWLIYSIP
jgi:hypothetical protein